MKILFSKVTLSDFLVIRPTTVYLYSVITKVLHYKSVGLL